MKKIYKIKLIKQEIFARHLKYNIYTYQTEIDKKYLFVTAEKLSNPKELTEYIEKLTTACKKPYNIYIKQTKNSPEHGELTTIYAYNNNIYTKLSPIEEETQQILNTQQLTEILKNNKEQQIIIIYAPQGHTHTINTDIHNTQNETIEKITEIFAETKYKLKEKKHKLKKYKIITEQTNLSNMQQITFKKITT